MASNYSDDLPERRARPIRNMLIVAVLAFLVGALVIGWALMRWAPARQLIGAEPSADASPASVAQVVAALPPVASTPAPGAPSILSPPNSGLPTPDVAIDARVGDLEERIARIDLRAAAAAGNAGRAEGLLIAFAARRAIDRGTGLGYVEGQLRDRFGSNQPRAVGAVIAAAQNPVTVAMLRQQLDAGAASLTGGTRNEGWWAATQRTLSTLVIVRKAAAGSPLPDDRLARARLMLDGGQVDGALAEVARLPGAASAEGWLTAARRYVEAHRALDIIEASAIMPPPPGAPSPVPN